MRFISSRTIQAPRCPNGVTLIKTAMADVVASQVSVRDLKTHRSEWLGRVQSGEVVEVASRVVAGANDVAG